ncbi:MAG: anaerobic sulfatase-maturation protein [Bacteroidales bacterium]
MAVRKYLTLNDAIKSTAPSSFSSMVKPVGAVCNLSCSYCYYLDKADYYGKNTGVMPAGILEEYIRQYIEANEIPEITFVWHGGEPLMAGIDFYKRAVALQRKYAGGKKIVNTIQTNGILLTPEWCRFFHDNNFLTGVSVDGPEDIHDAHRRNRSGQPSFEKVMHGVALLHRHRVEFNTLTVVTNLSEGRGREIYLFLKSLGSRYMQFLPVVEYQSESDRKGGKVIVNPGTEVSSAAPWNVTATGYGRFLTDIFDEWIVSDVGRYFVQAFDMALAQWAGVRPGLCVYCETCGDALAVEHNGDVYSCDHFVYPEFRLGNLMETSLSDLYRSIRQFEFGVNKRNSLPVYCLRCKYHFACRGECPKHRFIKTPSGEPGLNALCEGFKQYYAHVEPYMLYMSNLLMQKQPPALVMEWARARMGQNR